MTYFPSTKNAKLAVSDVILVKPYSTSFYVTLVKENTDMIRLYPGAIYGFRVIKLKH